MPALCNRLDRNTSGIVVVGKTAEAVRKLNEAVKNKRIRKLYMTLVKGEVKNPGRIFTAKTKKTIKRHWEAEKRR